jgi:hypothetical protein
MEADNTDAVLILLNARALTTGEARQDPTLRCV